MTYSLSHLSDQTLLRDLATLVARDRATTAMLLAHIAEVDARKLYLPAGYPSMYAYCVGELRMSEDAACKRIRGARAAREFPVILEAVAEGRLHLSAVSLLAPHLTPSNVDDLLKAATHKTKPEIEQLLANRFPQADLPTRVRAVPLSPAMTFRQPDPATVHGTASLLELSVPGRIEPSVPKRIEEIPRPLVAPLAPQRYSLQLTMSQELHDMLRYAQELLSHQVPPGDVASVIQRALEALIPQLEKRKFAATDRPGPRRETTSARHIPAHVKRAVWARDGGQCSFVSDDGHRCSARNRLEFDHVEPVARGGKPSIPGVRLRCRAHNQYEAERVFGVEFMSNKREAG